MSSRSVPVDKKLYDKVKAEAKRRYKVWPSAYASGWLVKTYKARGGRYRKSGNRKSRRKSKSKRYRSRFSYKSNTGLNRWFKEEWIDVCTGKPCGRRSARKSRSRKYPYCRPKYRITSGTPRTARTLSKTQIKRLCSRKRKSPKKRVYIRKKSR